IRSFVKERVSMALYLVESVLAGKVKDKSGFEQTVAGIRQELDGRGAKLIEVQVAQDFSRAFFIFNSEERSSVVEGLRAQGVSVALIKQVRLIGKELSEVEQEKETINYLVEWNLPEGLTMEQYLERKRNNSVHYAEVPDVAFSRTYVCEDMTKCLCFYDAPDES